jgi:HEAT repeat protein
MTTLELLLESLGSSDTRQVLHSLDILAANDRGRLVPPLMLYHDDSEVRKRTLGVIAQTGRTDCLPLVERTLRDEDADVRAEAVRVLASMQGTDAAELMLPKLEEADAGVRAAAVACLANYGDDEMSERAGSVLLDLLRDADPAVRAEAAKAIGAVHEPMFQEHLIRMLYDVERSVVREAISAIQRRVARDGFNPLYVPTLVSLLQNRKVRHEARNALVAFGEPAVPTMVHFMNAEDEPLWVRRALPKAIAAVGSYVAAEALLDGLEKSKDSFHRRKLVEALGSIYDVEAFFQQESERLEWEISHEAKRYLSLLAALEGLRLREKGRVEGARVVWDGDVSPTLLDRLLDERSASALLNVFGMLALLFGGREIWPAYRGLTSGEKMQRARALELLDNTLEGELKRHVFAVIDDCPMTEKFQRAKRSFGVRVRPLAETLDSYLTLRESDEPEAPALISAALYSVHMEEVSGLEQRVSSLAADAEDPFVHETAIWISGRLGLETA